MDTKIDSKQEVGNTGKDLVSMDAEAKGTSRRKFTRNVLVGSAVLLTLNNRSAWGNTEELMCISNSLLASYNNAQASALTDVQENEINNFMIVRDNTNPSEGSHRTGEVIEGSVDTCFTYKPK